MLTVKACYEYMFKERMAVHVLPILSEIKRPRIFITIVQRTEPLGFRPTFVALRLRKLMGGGGILNAGIWPDRFTDATRTNPIGGGSNHFKGDL